MESNIFEKIRVAFKKKNNKINVFRTVDDNTLYRIGMFKQHVGIEEAKKILEEAGAINIEAKYEETTHPIIDFRIPTDKTVSNLVEEFIAMDNSTVAKMDVNIEIIMRAILKLLANKIVEKNVESAYELNQLVNEHNTIFENFKTGVWISDMPKARKKLLFKASINETNLFMKFYNNFVLPQIKEAYPHWRW